MPLSFWLALLRLAPAPFARVRELLFEREALLRLCFAPDAFEGDDPPEERGELLRD